MSTLSKNLSLYRKEANITQEEFAARLGVTPQAVSKWERGNSLPDIGLLCDICRLLNISSDVLLGIHEPSICENKDTSFERAIKQNMIAEPLRLEFGYGLVPCIQSGLKTDYLNQCRKKLAKETGMLMPLLRIMDSGDAKDREIMIFSYDKLLMKKEYATADEQTYRQIMDDVIVQCRKNYGSILNKQIVKFMCDNVEEQYPGILDGLIPDRVTYYEVMLYLRQYMGGHGELRNLIRILEELEGTCKG